MSDRVADFVKGLLVGGAIGAGLGILYAPKSGKETREDICRKTDDLLAKAKDEYEQAAKKVSELAEKGKETVQDSRSRLKRAVDAGVEAYREEQEKTQ